MSHDPEVIRAYAWAHLNSALAPNTVYNFPTVLQNLWVIDIDKKVKAPGTYGHYTDEQIGGILGARTYFDTPFLQRVIHTYRL